MNLCQPCYCDKVRELASFSSRSAQTSRFAKFNPTLSYPALTRSPFFLLCFFLFPPSFLLSFPPSLFDFSRQNSSLILYSSSARTQRKPSPRARPSTALIATTGTADPVSSAGASIDTHVVPPRPCSLLALEFCPSTTNNITISIPISHTHIHPTHLLAAAQPHTCGGVPSLLSCISRLHQSNQISSVALPIYLKFSLSRS